MLIQLLSKQIEKVAVLTNDLQYGSVNRNPKRIIAAQIAMLPPLNVSIDEIKKAIASIKNAVIIVENEV